MDELSLKPFSQENVERTFDWVRQKELRELFTIRGEPTWERHMSYFESVLQDVSQRVFAIYIGRSHAGNCGLKNMTSDKAELWIYIGSSKDRRSGFGKTACSKLIQVAREIGLFTLYLHVLRSNAPAVRLYEGLGFKAVVNTSVSAGDWGSRGLDVIRMERVIGAA